MEPLSDTRFEEQIRERLQQELKEYNDGCQVTVSRPGRNEWKIEVDAGGGRKHSVTRQEAHQPPVHQIVEEAALMIKLASQQEMAFCGGKL